LICACRILQLDGNTRSRFELQTSAILKVPKADQLRLPSKPRLQLTALYITLLLRRCISSLVPALSYLSSDKTDWLSRREV
jgi:hypothetical protein